MIGKPYLWDVKTVDTDSRAMQYEVYLALWGMARMRRRIGDVSVFQTSCGKKQIEFPASPECVEIPGYNDVFIDIANESVQLFQLVLPVSIL